MNLLVCVSDIFYYRKNSSVNFMLINLWNCYNGKGGIYETV